MKMMSGSLMSVFLEEPRWLQKQWRKLFTLPQKWSDQGFTIARPISTAFAQCPRRCGMGREPLQMKRETWEWLIVTDKRNRQMQVDQDKKKPPPEWRDVKQGCLDEELDKRPDARACHQRLTMLYRDTVPPISIEYISKQKSSITLRTELIWIEWWEFVWGRTANTWASQWSTWTMVIQEIDCTVYSLYLLK